MNYRYTFIGKDHILSKEEHEKVVSALKAGRTLMMLRGDTLILNLSSPFSVNPTGNQTEKQEEQQMERLQQASEGKGGLMLGDPVPENLKNKDSYAKKTHFAFYEKMDMKHKPMCVCKHAEWK